MNKKRAIDSFKQTSELHQTGGRAKLIFNLYKYSFNESFAPDQHKFCAVFKAPTQVPAEPHARLRWLLASASNRWGKKRLPCIGEGIPLKHGGKRQPAESFHPSEPPVVICEPFD